jgi:hypothetical protein
MESYMMILCVLLLLFIHTPMDQTPLLCLVCDLCFACWTTRTPTAYYTFESITYEKETENIIYMPSIQLKRRQIKKARSMPHQSHWTCRRRCIYCSRWPTGKNKIEERKKKEYTMAVFTFNAKLYSCTVSYYIRIMEGKTIGHAPKGWMDDASTTTATPCSYR